MSDKLKIELEKCFDRNKNPYYIGKLRAPIQIDCSADGICFIVFISSEGNEELHISSISKKYNPDNDQ
jgi:hypothetical protein